MVFSDPMVSPIHPSRFGHDDDAISLASTLDFHGVWRELKASGWTSKPPRGLDNRYRYVLPGPDGDGGVVVGFGRVRGAGSAAEQQRVGQGRGVRAAGVQVPAAAAAADGDGDIVVGSGRVRGVGDDTGNSGAVIASPTIPTSSAISTTPRYPTSLISSIENLVLKNMVKPKNEMILQIMWLDTMFQNAVEVVTIATVQRGIDNYQTIMRLFDKPSSRDLTDTIVGGELNMDLALDELEIASDEEGYERYTQNGLCQRVLQRSTRMEGLMTFLGIMFYMTLTDKGEYSNYWGSLTEDAIFGGAIYQLGHCDESAQIQVDQPLFGFS
ncbi:unnamed protein product [Phytophthora fragariaefolia]|uniref:Unnamed protein product n=1 Tax=Phytophthora fragariaefolia TaxID=1490495 RepID=A0A9W6XGF3_9STRA|nr:unnamed protein product [Phytophthora fragariaefolia]